MVRERERRRVRLAALAGACVALGVALGWTGAHLVAFGEPPLGLAAGPAAGPAIGDPAEPSPRTGPGFRAEPPPEPALALRRPVALPAPTSARAAGAGGSDSSDAAAAHVAAARPGPLVEGSGAALEPSPERRFEECLALGLLDEARAILESGLAGSGREGELARELSAAGRGTEAAPLFERAFEREPFERDWPEGLLASAPDRALALLDTQLERFGLGATAVGAARRADALARIGRADEALALLERAVRSDPEAAPAWELLASLDPSAAEAACRELVASSAGDPALAVRLVELRRDLGHEITDEDRAVLAGAVAAIDAGDRHAPDARLRALVTLIEVDPESGRAHLEAAARSLDAAARAHAWGALGDALEARERPELAVDAWLRSVALVPDGGRSRALRERAPERYLATLERAATGTTDDERIGNLADEYWAVGRRDEACDAWMRAHLIDPDDGEWTTKLAAVVRGEDPRAATMAICYLRGNGY